MKEIDEKIIKFLLTGKVYSELAIIKHFGITYDELQEVYSRLEKNGYLESYNEYMAKHHNCSNCASSDNGKCSKTCPVEKEDDDYSDIRVITNKAILDFAE